MYDEVQIIERVLSGQPAAFRSLVEWHQPLIFQFARNLLKNVQDAEDLTQEVFVAAYQNLATFDRSKARLSTWLLTIARNHCLNQLKHRDASSTADIDAIDHRPSPDDVALKHEVWQHLDAALEVLPIEQRTAFILAEIQELPHAEIAIIEGIELGTVKSRVSRARERLRHAMKAWRPEPTLPPRNHS